MDALAADCADFAASLGVDDNDLLLANLF